MSRGIWATLGIDPTTDRSAIRRAYAAKLRAMDVDADPAGFARLRDARDAALAGVDDPVAVPDEIDDEPDDAALIAEAYVDPVDVGHMAEIERRFRALEALLFPGHDDPPTPAEAVAIRQHGAALLADPRLEQVDFVVRAERWFAEHLCLATPRADPMLEQAAAAFGWIERRDDHALSWQARQIVDRIGAIRFAALVGDPTHRLHRAWVELNRSDSRRAPLWNPKGPRRELLSLIRTRYPIVESWIEPRRIADTDDTGSFLSNVPVWGIIAIFVLILRAAYSTEPSHTPPVPPLYAPNPVVETPAPAAPPTSTARSDVDRYVSALTHSPDSYIREITEWELKVMRYYEPHDPAQCVDTGVFRSDPKLSTDWAERRNDLIGRLLHYARDETLPPPPSRFVIRGEIVGAVRHRSGLNQADFKQSFDPDAPVADQCKTMIAIREVALARPKVGTKLLRQLQLSGFGE